MTPQELFVTTLRQHRQRNRLSLEEISIDTRIKIELFEDWSGTTSPSGHAGSTLEHGCGRTRRPSASTRQTP